MQQAAPFPDALSHLVKCLSYRPGWTFRLEDIDRGQGSKGLTLIITTRGYNSYHTDRGESYRVNHYMIVPAASYDMRSWQRWLFDQLLLVEKHEAMEFFVLHDSPGSEHVVHPYAPSHGPGNDPYVVREVGTELDSKTSFRGEINEGLVMLPYVPLMEDPEAEHQIIAIERGVVADTEKHMAQVRHVLAVSGDKDPLTGISRTYESRQGDEGDRLKAIPSPVTTAAMAMPRAASECTAARRRVR